MQHSRDFISAVEGERSEIAAKQSGLPEQLYRHKKDIPVTFDHRIPRRTMRPGGDSASCSGRLPLTRHSPAEATATVVSCSTAIVEDGAGCSVEPTMPKKHLEDVRVIVESATAHVTVPKRLEQDTSLLLHLSTTGNARAADDSATPERRDPARAPNHMGTQTTNTLAYCALNSRSTQTDEIAGDHSGGRFASWRAQQPPALGVGGFHPGLLSPSHMLSPSSGDKSRRSAAGASRDGGADDPTSLATAPDSASEAGLASNMNAAHNAHRQQILVADMMAREAKLLATLQKQISDHAKEVAAERDKADRAEALASKNADILRAERLQHEVALHELKIAVDQANKRTEEARGEIEALEGEVAKVKMLLAAEQESSLQASKDQSKRIVAAMERHLIRQHDESEQRNAARVADEQRRYQARREEWLRSLQLQDAVLQQQQAQQQPSSRGGSSPASSTASGSVGVATPPHHRPRKSIAPILASSNVGADPGESIGHSHSRSSSLIPPSSSPARPLAPTARSPSWVAVEKSPRTSLLRTSDNALTDESRLSSPSVTLLRSPESATAACRLAVPSSSRVPQSSSAKGQRGTTMRGTGATIAAAAVAVKPTAAAGRSSVGDDASARGGSALSARLAKSSPARLHSSAIAAAATVADDATVASSADIIDDDDDGVVVVVDAKSSLVTGTDDTFRSGSNTAASIATTAAEERSEEALPDAANNGDVELRGDVDEDLSMMNGGTHEDEGRGASTAVCSADADGGVAVTYHDERGAVVGRRKSRATSVSFQPNGPTHPHATEAAVAPGGGEVEEELETSSGALGQPRRESREGFHYHEAKSRGGGGGFGGPLDDVVPSRRAAPRRSVVANEALDVLRGDLIDDAGATLRAHVDQEAHQQAHDAVLEKLQSALTDFEALATTLRQRSASDVLVDAQSRTQECAEALRVHYETQHQQILERVKQREREVVALFTSKVGALEKELNLSAETVRSLHARMTSLEAEKDALSARATAAESRHSALERRTSELHAALLRQDEDHLCTACREAILRDEVKRWKSATSQLHDGSPSSPHAAAPPNMRPVLQTRPAVVHRATPPSPLPSSAAAGGPDASGLDSTAATAPRDPRRPSTSDEIASGGGGSTARRKSHSNRTTAITATLRLGDDALVPPLSEATGETMVLGGAAAIATTIPEQVRRTPSKRLGGHPHHHRGQQHIINALAKEGPSGFPCA